MNNQIAYKGPKFTIERYFGDNEQSQALDYYNNLDERRQDKTLYRFMS